LKFGLFFVGIFFLQRIASTSLGEPGVYLASALGGVGSMSAVALSTAELVERDALTIGGGAISIFIGMTANALMKGLLALVSGSRSLTFWLVAGLAAVLLVGGSVMIATSGPPW
jgi:uncharacterized membrane protein (DUF4010 family)